MRIVPLNAALVTKAIESMMRDSLTIGQAGVVVERAGDPDQSPEDKGFVGIYRDRQRFPPRTLGVHAGFRQQHVGIVLLLKASNPVSGADCEDALEQLIADVVGTLLTDPSLKGTVSMLAEEFDVRYDKYDKVGGIYQQRAALFLTGLVNVSVQ